MTFSRVPEVSFAALSLFVIDSLFKKRYTPAAPQDAKKAASNWRKAKQLATSNWQLTKPKHLATGNWQLAKKRPVLGSWYLVLGMAELYDPLPILGCLGWKWVNIGGQGGGGLAEGRKQRAARNAVITRHRHDRKGKTPPLMNTDDTILANISHCGWLKTTNFGRWTGIAKQNQQIERRRMARYVHHLSCSTSCVTQRIGRFCLGHNLVRRRP